MSCPSGNNIALAPIRGKSPSRVEFFLNYMEMNDSMARVFTFIHNYTAMQYSATHIYVHRSHIINNNIAVLPFQRHF